MNKLTKNIIKLHSIPRCIAAKKLLSLPLKKLFGQKSNRDELTYTDNRQITSVSLNLEPFFNLIPDYDEISKFKNELSELSSRTILHEFDILGSGYHKYVNNLKRDEFLATGINPANQNTARKILSMLPDDYKLINWQIDIRSKYQWDAAIKSKLLNYEDLQGTDVKLPWELGRLQHLIPLAYSASIEEDKLYLRELENQLIDFIGSNPPDYGIQWKSSMDVAIRLINIIFVFSIIKKFNVSANKEFDNLIIRSISEHIFHIKNNLEWNNGLRGNHYLFNLVGVLLGELFLSRSFETRENFRFALSELRNEILYQFNKDGGNFEASLPYHYFTSEAILLCRELLHQSGIKLAVNNETAERIEKIIEFSVANIDNNKCIWQIGDNDSGYLLKLFPDDILLRAELTVAHVIRYIHSKYNDTEKNFFPDFGLFNFKNDKIFFTFRCGDVGQKGKGGHAHNDALSFCLKVRGWPFFVDPGSFCYLPFPDERNKFRSSMYHNILTVDGKEQNIMLSNSPGDLFWLIPRAKPEMSVIDSRHVKGKHKGYGTKTERIVKISDNSIDITDICGINADKKIHFHLHPDVSIREENGQLILSNQDVSIRLIINDKKHSIVDYDYSPSYGIKENAKKIIIFSHSNQINWSINY